MALQVKENPYLAPFQSYSGGWGGIVAARVTPTYLGIRSCIERFKIDAEVHTDQDSLIEAIRKVERCAAFVIDSGLVDSEDGELTQHVISLFVIRTKSKLQIINNNSQASSSFFMPKIFTRSFPRISVQYFVSAVARQSVSTCTCQSFAMNDCSIFSAELVDDILKMNQYEQMLDSGCFRIEKLPKEMQTLVCEKLADQYLQKCIDYLQSPLPMQKKITRKKQNENSCQKMVAISATILIVATGFFARLIYR